MIMNSEKKSGIILYQIKELRQPQKILHNIKGNENGKNKSWTIKKGFNLLGFQPQPLDQVEGFR